ncbi:hypothetical protein ACIRL2_38370 [Embleya sp. NPDC127516]|uniref:hypothetical protein n=1 Tax=Embleya sp. NPDC127516 TaxID=3363990 RepID=UPI0037F9266F
MGRRTEGRDGATRAPETPPAALDGADTRFILGLAVPGCSRFTSNEAGRRSTNLGHPDGSWATFEHATGTVAQGGPRRLWDAINAIHREWQAAGSAPHDLQLRIDGTRQTLYLPGKPGGWRLDG